MSSRRNISGYEFDEQSLQLHDHELLTTIGITPNKSSIQCLIDNNAHDYKYGRSHAQILSNIINIFRRQQELAFHQIQKITHYHRDHINTLFLPQALNHGNYNALSKFLAQLKTNKVGAYVNLSLKESKGYFLKGATLLKPVAKMIKDRLRYVLGRIKKNMVESIQRDQRNILEQLDKLSSIQNKDSYNGQRHGTKQQRSSIKLTYKQIHIPKRQNRVQPINIKDLIENTREKQYHIQRVNNWNKGVKSGSKLSEKDYDCRKQNGIVKCWVLSRKM